MDSPAEIKELQTVPSGVFEFLERNQIKQRKRIHSNDLHTCMQRRSDLGDTDGCCYEALLSQPSEPKVPCYGLPGILSTPPPSFSSALSLRLGSPLQRPLHSSVSRPKANQGARLCPSPGCQAERRRQPPPLPLPWWDTEGFCRESPSLKPPHRKKDHEAVGFVSTSRFTFNSGHAKCGIFSPIRLLSQWQ